MAINLASKYAKKTADKFYTASVVVGKTSRDYEWDGVNTINVYTITTQPTVAYNRAAASNRYGTPTEVEDTIQPMTITQDRSVSLVVDKGNNTQQMLIKNAGKVTALEMREQFIPEFDKYCLKTWGEKAGTNTVHASLSKTTIVEAISDHVTALMNAGASIQDATCFIGATHFAKLVLSPEFLHLEKLGGKALGLGVLGQVRGLNICPVPDSYLGALDKVGGGTVNCNFLTVKKSSVLAPTQIKDMKVHKDAVGYSGAVMEFRWLYDAFVIATKNKGVIVDTDASL